MDRPFVGSRHANAIHFSWQGFASFAMVLVVFACGGVVFTQVSLPKTTELAVPQVNLHFINGESNFLQAVNNTERMQAQTVQLLNQEAQGQALLRMQDTLSRLQAEMHGGASLTPVVQSLSNKFEELMRNVTALQSATRHTADNISSLRSAVQSVSNGFDELKHNVTALQQDAYERGTCTCDMSVDDSLVAVYVDGRSMATSVTGDSRQLPLPTAEYPGNCSFAIQFPCGTRTLLAIAAANCPSGSHLRVSCTSTNSNSPWNGLTASTGTWKEMGGPSYDYRSQCDAHYRYEGSLDFAPGDWYMPSYDDSNWDDARALDGNFHFDYAKVFRSPKF